MLQYVNLQYLCPEEGINVYDATGSEINCIFSDPDLIYEKCLEGAEGFEGALDLFPAGYRPGHIRPEFSGNYQ